jgi:uncharacterized membrane protein YfcA
MAIIGLAPEAMRPTALALNMLVSIITTLRFARAGHFKLHAFYPFALASVPLAFFGGALHLPSGIYKPIVGVILLLSAGQLARSAYGGGHARRAPRAPLRPRAPAASRSRLARRHP